MKFFILNILYAALIFHCTFTGAQQCEKYFDDKLNLIVYTSVDNLPEYPGGITEFFSFFSNNFQAQDQDYLQVTFKVEFIVDSDGGILNPKIIGEETEKLTPKEIEVIRIIGIIPNWEPGSCNEKVVPVKIRMPIRISLP